MLLSCFIYSLYVDTNIVLYTQSACWCYCRALYTVCMLILISCCIYSLHADATVVLYIQSACWCYCRAVYTVCMLMLLSCCIYSLYVATVVLARYVPMWRHFNCKLYYQQLHLKYWCNLARYWLQAVWGWHDSVETCSSVIICEILHLLVIVQNKQ